MATVTAFTAARSQAIEDQAIVDGAVVAGNLILTRNNGLTINAGSVIGPTGPEGPVGEVSDAELTAAIAGVNASIAAAPLGVLGLAEVSTDQDFAGFTADIWHDITGASVTFTVVANRHYLFLSTASFMSEGAGATFDLRILRTGGSAVAAGGAYIHGASKTLPVNADRTLVTPSGWAGSQTFKLQERHNTDFAAHVMGSGYTTSLSVIDLGAI